jgi:hypothetical protein
VAVAKPTGLEASGAQAIRSKAEPEVPDLQAGPARLDLRRSPEGLRAAVLLRVDRFREAAMSTQPDSSEEALAIRALPAMRARPVPAPGPPVCCRLLAGQDCRLVEPSRPEV